MIVGVTNAPVESMTLFCTSFMLLPVPPLVILGEAIAELAAGMAELSNGLRATYILLE